MYEWTVIWVFITVKPLNFTGLFDFYYLSVLYSEIMSSSSLSSSESDTGIYTNDEGREGNNTKYKLTNMKQMFMILSIMM